MDRDILIEDIKDFRKSYLSNFENAVSENEIRDLGLKKASCNKNKLNEYEFKFNIMVPDVKIHNQRNSYQCNIFAFLRVVKDVMRKRGIEDIDLSANYIAFFDMFEKINSLYNELLDDNDLTIDKIRNDVNRYVGNFGTFHFAREIINKYGLVPESIYSDVNDKFEGNLTLELLRDKIKVDALSLLGLSIKNKEVKKKELMEEAFTFLSKIYGNPPLQFNYLGDNMSPLDFKEKLVGNMLDNFVTVTSFDLQNFYDSNSFIPSVYLNDNEKIVHRDIKEQIEAIILQLKDGISVWFSAEETTTLDYEDNILDSKLYDYNTLLNIIDIPRDKKLILDIISYDHAMTITGANIKNEKVTQFKVDNSFGLHGQFDGKLIMTTDFFKEYVITTIIDKKYLDNN